MTSPDERAPRDPKVARGRAQTRAAAFTLLGAIGLVALLGGTPLPMLVLQVLVTGLLWMQVFRGRGWARWTLVGLTALGAIANVHVVLAGHARGAWVLPAALAAVFALTAGVLALSAPVSAYLADQRERHP